MKLWRSSLAVGCFALACLTVAHPVHGAPETAFAPPPPELFTTENASGATPRTTQIPRDTFALPPGSALRLRLSPNTVYEGNIVAATDTAFGSRVVRGRLQNTHDAAPGGSFIAVAHGTATAAAVCVSPAERYALDGSGVLRALRGPSTARCACAPHAGSPAARSVPNLHTLRPSLAAANANIAETDAAPLEFDALIVYTPAALRAEGGSADAVAAQAELAMADANTCYQNSGIPIHGRIVGVRPVDYAESGEIKTDLHRLAAPGDGFLDEVQAMRDAARADFVCLFTDRASAEGFNGYAEILTRLRPDYEALGYSVVNITQAGVEHLFAHELGHNMGCDHDRENTTGLRLFDFSYGWRFTGGDGKLYRDVMAYAPGDSVPFFGGPLVNFAGVPTGVAGYADTARTLTLSAPTFVNFRPADGRARVALRATVAQASVDSRGKARAAFQFERTGSVAADLTVAYTVGGTAAAGVNYEALPGRFTIPAGRHFQALRVTGRPDGAAFGAGTVTLALQDAEGSVAADDPDTGAARTATATLLDRLPLVGWDAVARLSANGKKIQFTLHRVGPVDAALTVRYTVGGTAVAGVDYVPPAGTVTFAAGADRAVAKIKLVSPGAGSGSGRTVELTLTPDGAAYNVAAPGVAGYSW